LSSGEEEQIELTLRNLDDWNVDFLMVAEVLDLNLLPVVCLKLLICYDLIVGLNLDFDLLFNFLTAVQERHQPGVLFHNASKSADMIQASHYLLQHGVEQLGILQPLHKFVLFFACSIFHLNHPGLSNDFLVRVKHPRAVRYNDKAVNENYALSQAFTLLNDPELFFLIHVPREGKDVFRRLLIQVVLRCDLKQHFQQLTLFKTKIASEFSSNQAGGNAAAPGQAPPTVEEDVLVLLTASLKMAQFSWSARPLTIMLRWSERLVDEFFSQGECEKDLPNFGPTSAFCDRDLTDSGKVSLGFMHVLSGPLATAYCSFLGDASCQKQVLQEGLEANKSYLQSWVT